MDAMFYVIFHEEFDVYPRVDPKLTGPYCRKDALRMNVQITDLSGNRP